VRPGIFWALESPKLHELFTGPNGVELFADEVAAGRRGAVVQQALAQAVKDGIAPASADARDWKPVRVFVAQYPSFMYRQAKRPWSSRLVDAFDEYLDRTTELAQLPEAAFIEATHVDWLVGA
jgi:hypothetical protein